MDLVDPKLQAYAEKHTSDETPLLQKMNRETYSQVLMSRMLSGHLQGGFLTMISYMIRPACILEIGTYTGYSAICLAKGLREGGNLITIDRNEELEGRTKKYFNDSGLTDKIDFRIGDARVIIPRLTEKFDLVFIDADKENYSLYFDLVFDKVNTGGFLLADNVLWSGKVIDPKPDKDTQAIIEFNKKIQSDNRVENVLLPIRDGIMIIRKI